MIETFIYWFTPIAIEILELMGIIILTIAAFTAFFNYAVGLITRKQTHIKLAFANSMATALEFKLGAEILKTVIVHDFSEVLMLATIIILRALMAFIIYAEMKADKALEGHEDTGVN